MFVTIAIKEKIVNLKGSRHGRGMSGEVGMGSCKYNAYINLIKEGGEGEEEENWFGRDPKSSLSLDLVNKRVTTYGNCAGSKERIHKWCLHFVFKV